MSTLKRSAPLRRTPFKSRSWKPAAPREELVRPPLTPPSGWRIAQPVQARAIQVEKRTYVRDEALRKAYRAIPCQNCMRNDGTVCCAHANWAAHGKGKSIKASDDRGAALCFECHSGLDQGRELTREERRQVWEGAHRRSVELLVSEGLWPAHIPAPTFDAQHRKDYP
jgi:hypothetical protein